MSLSDEICSTILLLKRWSCDVWSVVIFCSSSFKICNRLQIVGWGRSCISQGAPANLSYFPTHTTHPRTKATHPKYFLNTAHPKHCPKPISLKQAANGYFDNGNCSNIVLRWMKRYLAEFHLNDTFSRQDLPLVTDDKARQ